jgi:hypothetical protein
MRRKDLEKNIVGIVQTKVIPLGFGLQSEDYAGKFNHLAVFVKVFKDLTVTMTLRFMKPNYLKMEASIDVYSAFVSSELSKVGALINAEANFKEGRVVRSKYCFPIQSQVCAGIILANRFKKSNHQETIKRQVEHVKADFVKSEDSLQDLALELITQFDEES